MDEASWGHPYILCKLWKKRRQKIVWKSAVWKLWTLLHGSAESLKSLSSKFCLEKKNHAWWKTSTSASTQTIQVLIQTTEGQMMSLTMETATSRSGSVQWVTRPGCTILKRGDPDLITISTGEIESPTLTISWILLQKENILPRTGCSFTSPITTVIYVEWKGPGNPSIHPECRSL